MKKQIRRITSFILSITLLLSVLNSTVVALPLNSSKQFDRFEHFNFDEMPNGLKKHLNNKKGIVKLDTVNADRIDSFTVVLSDGTKTMYSYDSPIKYIDEEGHVRFIDNSLKLSLDADGIFKWYAYENAANDLKTYFPFHVKTGVLIEGDGGSLRMIPKAKKNSLVSKKGDGEDEYIVYEDVFDKGIDVRYTARSNGIKEDIVLERYTGINEFEYTIETNGLTPLRNAGNEIEFINSKGETVYTLGEIFIEDSANIPSVSCNNRYTLKALGKHKYKLTMTVDEEFLTNPDTVYPVAIDPPVTTPIDRGFISTVYNKNGGGTAGTVHPIYTTGGEISSVVHLQLMSIMVWGCFLELPSELLI